MFTARVAKRAKVMFSQAICLSIEVVYSGKQTDATAIDFQPIGNRLTNELWDFKVQWQWRLSVYHYGRAVRILLECILVWFYF